MNTPNYTATSEQIKGPPWWLVAKYGVEVPPPAQPTKNMKHSVEITKQAALLLIGNDEKSWHDFKQSELYEKTIYKANGVFITVFHNYVSNATQYFVQDINA